MRRVLPLLVAFVVIAGAAAWLNRDAVLRGIADWWIVSDAPASADAVAIFGGGLSDRPFAAAAYYKQGLVKRIVISNVKASPGERLGVEISHVAANRAVLLKLGVPEDAIDTFGHDLTNTESEVVALHEWATKTGIHSLIVPTEIFSARRVAWTMHHVFGNDTAVRVLAVDPPEYDRTSWWHDETGLVALQNEIVKYVYYRLRY